MNLKFIKNVIQVNYDFKHYVKKKTMILNSK